jgi:hypothetical protein
MAGSGADTDAMVNRHGASQVSRVSQSLWGQLVEAYERADTDAELAFHAFDLVPLADNDESPSDVAANYEALRAIRDQWEDKLLSVEAPTVQAAAYQLRLFARRYHGADLATAYAYADDQVAALRRIYDSLERARRA